MANQKRLSFFEGYIWVLDTGCRKKIFYLWRIYWGKESINKSRHQKLWTIYKVLLVLNCIQLISFWFLSILNYSHEIQSIIARFDPVDDSWTKLGNLQVARFGHGVIQVDNEFIVVGGYRSRRHNGYEMSTESCILNQQSIICTARQPQLSSFTYYPELMLV